jgi:hypothetical protein
MYATETILGSRNFPETIARHNLVFLNQITDKQEISALLQVDGWCN